jgi:hypothetical protein
MNNLNSSWFSSWFSSCLSSHQILVWGQTVRKPPEDRRDPHETLTLGVYIISIQEAGADIGADFATERAKNWHVERVHVLSPNDSLTDYR